MDTNTFLHRDSKCGPTCGSSNTSVLSRTQQSIFHDISDLWSIFLPAGNQTWLWKVPPIIDDFLYKNFGETENFFGCDALGLLKLQEPKSTV